MPTKSGHCLCGEVRFEYSGQEDLVRTLSLRKLPPQHVITLYNVVRRP
jgi:hypothetical protein